MRRIRGGGAGCDRPRAKREFSEVRQKEKWRLVETLPAVQHDPHRPEDVLKVDADEDGVGGDDAADAIRHLVATKSRTAAQRKLCGL